MYGETMSSCDYFLHKAISTDVSRSYLASLAHKSATSSVVCSVHTYTRWKHSMAVKFTFMAPSFIIVGADTCNPIIFTLSYLIPQSTNAKFSACLTILLFVGNTFKKSYITASIIQDLSFNFARIPETPGVVGGL